MKTIRTFVAIPLSDEVSRKAIRLIERLRHPGDGIKWNDRSVIVGKKALRDIDGDVTLVVGDFE